MRIVHYRRRGLLLITTLVIGVWLLLAYLGRTQPTGPAPDIDRAKPRVYYDTTASQAVTYELTEDDSLIRIASILVADAPPQGIEYQLLLTLQNADRSEAW